MEEVFITKNREETVKLGETFSKRWHLREGATLATIALYGELGSGKTTFVQGLAKGFGIKKRIISPTFVLIRQYKILPPRSPSLRLRSGQAGHLGGGEATTSTPPRCNVFYHIDLYRIENERGIEGLELKEILNDPQNLVVIEWAEKIKNLLPKKRIDIRFEYLNEDERKITVEKF